MNRVVNKMNKMSKTEINKLSRIEAFFILAYLINLYSLGTLKAQSS